jgi:FkbM family methyltransferase
MATLERNNAASPGEAAKKSALVARLKTALRPLAPAARQLLPWRAETPSWEKSFAVLRRYGLQPATVFDIGVAYGTYELYRAFPNAFYHLIDPTFESLHHMRELGRRRLHCEIHSVALGNCEGEVMIEIRPDIQGATLLEDFTPREILRHDRVPMRRFDSLFGQIARPALAKIDVQGAELMVLEGMSGRMDSLDALVVETSTIASVKGGAEVHDVVRFMHGHGFVLSDVVGLTRRPLDSATAQLDLLFLRDDAGPRRDRRWAEAM